MLREVWGFIKGIILSICMTITVFACLCLLELHDERRIAIIVDGHKKDKRQLHYEKETKESKETDKVEIGFH